MDLSDIAASTASRYRTTQSMVTAGLRDAIVAGVLEEGQALRQDDIAGQFGVSRSPVREALRRLEGEGLVRFYAHRGAVVAEMSSEEVLEGSEIRVALETLALEKAIPNQTEDDLRGAEDILDVIDREIDITARWSELNREFHSALYAAADRPRLLELIRIQQVGFDRYIRVFLAVADYVERGQEEHRQLLAACRRDDVDLAVRLNAQYIDNVCKTLLDFFDRRHKENREAPRRVRSAGGLPL